MDADERARLRALCEAATPGPWVTGEGAAGRFMVSTDDGVCCVGGVRRVVFEINDGCAPWRFPDGPIPEAQLIAASRTAIPALLDDSERLDAVTRERDEARAEVERLRRERVQEREACAEICDALGDAAEVERDACCDDRSRSLHAGRMHGADECARAIRARGAGGAR